ncbi:hypothetical protein FKM82_027784 [Ascaphus truei]
MAYGDKIDCILSSIGVMVTILSGPPPVPAEVLWDSAIFSLTFLLKVRMLFEVCKSCSGKLLRHGLLNMSTHMQHMKFFSAVRV